jgi:diguanylate cyclase (GGDEF)-like protein
MSEAWAAVAPACASGAHAPLSIVGETNQGKAMNGESVTQTAFGGLSGDEIEQRLNRLAELERLMKERSDELMWASERLVAELYDRTAAEAEANRLQHYDAVTGLPNRRGFERKLERAIEVHLQNGEPAAVVFVGIARLQDVRESLGYQAADQVVRLLADRLRMVVRGSDVIGRVGDDDFALLLQQLRQSVDAASVARKLFDAIDVPLQVEHRSLRLEPAVGVAVCPHDATAADLLLARADSAMHHARRHGTGLYQFFRPDLAQRAARRLGLEAELRDAIEHRQFRVHFQPRFDVRSHRVVGAEALLRWEHPTRGLLAPAEFLDIAEDSGLIVPIGEQVLGQACAAAAAWPGNISVAVNLSPREFRGRSMMSIVDQALRTSGLSPARLQIEINEAGLNGPVDEADVAALQTLRAAGVKVALDDFGAGAANLSLLRRLPVDSLKIDGQFVRHAADSRKDALIVAAIAGLGRRLGLRVIAEGIETSGQLALVKKCGCHEAQGYLLGRPMQADEFFTALPAPSRRRVRSRTPSAGGEVGTGRRPAMRPAG